MQGTVRYAVNADSIQLDRERRATLLKMQAMKDQIIKEQDSKKDHNQAAPSSPMASTPHDPTPLKQENSQVVNSFLNSAKRKDSSSDNSKNLSAFDRFKNRYRRSLIVKEYLPCFRQQHLSTY